MFERTNTVLEMAEWRAERQVRNVEGLKNLMWYKIRAWHSEFLRNARCAGTRGRSDHRDVWLSLGSDYRGPTVKMSIIFLIFLWKLAEVKKTVDSKNE